ncbi:MAG: aminotransferase class I/II-fold pyridoxal phosphate-dependent enzyme, partial [Gaiellaceae bacterium]
MTEPIRLARPDVGEEELAAVAEVIETGQLTMGPKVAEFEEAIARAVGTAHAAAVSSGTAALHLALLALEIGPGDEVIVPAYTFPATANAVELCGARAVLVDVDPDTFVLEPGAVAAALTPRTRAVLAVHLFGRPVAWEALQTAVPQDVLLVEDAAGALGARYRGTPCGALGVAGCLSFHPRKIVTTGEGGAVTTDEAGLDAAVRRFRHHGWATLGDMPAPGLNYRLPDVLCAIGIPQLARLEELLAA